MEISEVLNYTAYFFQRRTKSAETLALKFPMADKFERRYQEDLAAAGGASPEVA